jgi:hypothetical protein
MSIWAMARNAEKAIFRSSLYLFNIFRMAIPAPKPLAPA